MKNPRKKLFLGVILLVLGLGGPIVFSAFSAWMDAQEESSRVLKSENYAYARWPTGKFSYVEYVRAGGDEEMLKETKTLYFSSSRYTLLISMWPVPRVHMWGKSGGELSGGAKRVAGYRLFRLLDEGRRRTLTSSGIG